MGTPKTIITSEITTALEKLLENYNSADIFILTDENSQKHCLPILMKTNKLKASHIVAIKCGDENKDIHSAVEIWKYLSENGATRHSLMINVGGGMVTDIGGFAAATFKRGIEYINISTTLLGAVDAATGGKTGINFLGLKNEIGAFAPAKAVLINVDFFRTLDDKNIRSGFAEMIKHALIYSKEDFDEILKFDLEQIDYEKLKILLQKNIDIKESIVKADPTEAGIRKALNLGHTIGHAIESLSYKKGNPLLHGYAVAYGLVAELYLSRLKFGFPKDEFFKLKQFVKENYGTYNCGCTDYEELIQLMHHDKKNDRHGINFTLLSDVGEVKINQTATKREIEECLELALY